jgi:hypothetical protein
MARQKSSTSPSSGIALRGFAKVNLVDADTGAVQYESDWYPNAIVNSGMTMLVHRIASGTYAERASYPTHMDPATQTAAVNLTQTVASGEFGQRATTANSTNTGTSSNQFVNSFTASWNSTQATSAAIGALALYGSASGGSAYSIVLLTQTVSKQSTQTMNATYEWRFQTTS